MKNQYRKTMLLFLFLTSGCANINNNEAENLKNDGYTEFFCNNGALNQETRVYDVFSYVKPVNKNKEMIVARCKKLECTYNILDKNKSIEKLICNSFDFINNRIKFSPNQTLLVFNIKKILEKE